MDNKSENIAKLHITTPGTVHDELYLANGVAYIEADLKLVHLRILITIIAHLQRAFKHRISHRIRNAPQTLPSGHPQTFPTSHPRIGVHPLPAPGPLTAAGKTRVLHIPLSAFSMGRKNSAKLRLYLSELQSVRIDFPVSKSQPLLQRQFQGLLAGYSFPAYARSVEILLPEDLTWRLMLTEDGYTSFSHEGALSIRNKYTVRIYWLLCAWRNRGGFVMRLADLRRILCLSSAYNRIDNLIARVLAPAESELQSQFPIWFHYRIYNAHIPKVPSQNHDISDGSVHENMEYENRQEQGGQIVFKICLRVPEEQRTREMRSAWDYCFNLMASVGARQETLRNLFSRLDYEDLRPFMEKLVELTAYIRSHSITTPDRYILTVMDRWFTSWLHRYQ